MQTHAAFPRRGVELEHLLFLPKWPVVIATFGGTTVKHTLMSWSTNGQYDGN